MSTRRPAERAPRGATVQAYTGTGVDRRPSAWYRSLAPDQAVPRRHRPGAARMAASAMWPGLSRSNTPNVLRGGALCWSMMS